MKKLFSHQFGLSLTCLFGLDSFDENRDWLGLASDWRQYSDE